MQHRSEATPSMHGDEGADEIILRRSQRRGAAAVAAPVNPNSRVGTLLYGDDFVDEALGGGRSGAVAASIESRRQRALDQEEELRKLGSAAYNRKYNAGYRGPVMAYSHNGDVDDNAVAHMRRIQYEGQQTTWSAPVSGDIATDERFLGVGVTGDSMVPAAPGPLLDGLCERGAPSSAPPARADPYVGARANLAAAAAKELLLKPGQPATSAAPMELRKVRVVVEYDRDREGNQVKLKFTSGGASETITVKGSGGTVTDPDILQQFAAGRVRVEATGSGVTEVVVYLSS